MSSVDSFFSQAYNSVSALSGGVDPRTGQFNIVLKLANVVANNGLGPSVPAWLSYAPSVSTDQGFGIGFSLGLTTFDAGSGRLNLSTGEQYQVWINQNTGAMSILQTTLKDVSIESIEDGRYYRVTYRDGTIELLDGPQDAADLKQLRQRTSPSGHSLYFERDRAGRLLTVKDDSAQVLISINYSSPQSVDPVISTLPGCSEGYDLFLTLDGGYLKRISSNALGENDKSLAWQIDYVDMGALGPWGQWANKLTSPGGLVKEVVYSPNRELAHSYVESATVLQSVRMPYVTQLTVSPGGDQPASVRYYEYSPYNFLGFRAGTSWDPRFDPLYDCGFDYQYSSTVTQIDDAGVKTVVTCVYDCFHQQIKKVVQRGDTQTETDTTYYSIPGKGFAAQDPRFQLPKSTVTRISSTSSQAGNVTSRSQKTNYEYDVFGNQLSQANFITDDSGSFVVQDRVEWDYYPAAGQPYDAVSGLGCPADPVAYNRQNSIPRFVRTVTTTPTPSHYGDERPAIRRSSYEQYNFPDAVTPFAGNYTIFCSEQRQFSDTQLKSSVTYQYADAKQGSEFARLIKIENTHYPDGNLARGFTSSQQIAIRTVGEYLNRATTVMSHDNIIVKTGRISSRFTGRVTGRVNALGVHSSAVYDKLGRILSATSAVGTAYENTRNFSYSIGTDAVDDPFTVTVTDMLGNSGRTTLDGAFRALSAQIKLNGGSHWQALKSCQYDNLGRVAKTTTQDFYSSDDDDAYVNVTSHIRYDDWGKPFCVQSANGVSHFNISDPIGLTQTSFSQSAESKDADSTIFVDAADSVLRTARIVQATNPITLTETVASYENTATDTDSPYASVSARYDGWQRLRESTDALGNTSHYSYDLFGRVQDVTLPDGTVVSRTYSPDQPGAVVVDIKVDGRSLGTRTVDGLGRITSQTSEGCTWSATYDSRCGSLSSPATVTSPFNITSAYLYQPALGGKLISKSTVNGDQVSFTYKERTGALENASSLIDTATSSVANQFDGNGRLQNETFSQGGSATAYAYTTAGRLKSYTDIEGTIWAVQKVDAFGRPVLVADSAVQMELFYDALGRCYSFTATDIASKTTLTTTLSWDTLDREANRTFKSSTGKIWSIAYAYNRNNQVVEKTLQQNGEQVRQETFTYDNRNRLVSATYEGSYVPTDTKGNLIKTLAFKYDSISNITEATSTFTSGEDICTYHYAPDIPSRLVGLIHTHPSYPIATLLEYDEAGHMTDDGSGRSFVYHDGVLSGAIRSITKKGQNGASDVTAAFFYDPAGRLIKEDELTLFYRGSTLVNQMKGDNKTRFVNGPGGNLAQVRTGENQGVWLSGTEASGSVLSIQNQEEQHTNVYGAHGEQADDAVSPSVLGFNGERRSQILGGYHLGNGYRLYSPELRRFIAPDSMSPFGRGGINAYAYCEGDPINNIDPSGHSIFGTIGRGIRSAARGVRRAWRTIRTPSRDVRHEFGEARGAVRDDIHGVEVDEIGTEATEEFNFVYDVAGAVVQGVVAPEEEGPEIAEEVAENAQQESRHLQFLRTMPEHVSITTLEDGQIMIASDDSVPRAYAQNLFDRVIASGPMDTQREIAMNVFRDNWLRNGYEHDMYVANQEDPEFRYVRSRESFLPEEPAGRVDIFTNRPPGAGLAFDSYLSLESIASSEINHPVQMLDRRIAGLEAQGVPRANLGEHFAMRERMVNERQVARRNWVRVIDRANEQMIRLVGDWPARGFR